MWVEGWGRLPGELVVVSGPSGSGKSSVIRAALASTAVPLRLSVSATTRAPRPGEVDGVDYAFLDRPSFEEAIIRGDFLEWAEYNHNLYGTPAQPVYQALATGTSVLLEIEVRGAMQVQKQAPGALFVFFRTPTFRILEDRLRARGTEEESTILKRLRRAREELGESHRYDVVLVNDVFERCVADFEAVLRSHCKGG